LLDYLRIVSAIEAVESREVSIKNLFELFDAVSRVNVGKLTFEKSVDFFEQ